ncbi:MAG TPA: rhomboid family intramembrane serine protease, partial [Acidimicrobiaceae bacterium]|nr:rhomboid family intramembrane serine protease [Acidimicrobiaceae bacterium]
ALQNELDVLLDKVSSSGLDALSSDEKKRLNELSKRLR